MRGFGRKLGAGLWVLALCAMALGVSVVPALATDPVAPDYAALTNSLWTNIQAGVVAMLPNFLGLFAVMVVIFLIWRFGKKAVKG